MDRIIYHEKIHSSNPRLKRHIYHDSKSKLFAFPTQGLTIKDANHIRHIPILDQGQVGSCTGNAGIGGLSTDPLFATLPKPLTYSLDENGAVKLYSDAEIIDGSGAYPPNDNGSCGLSIAKALLNAGVISGYQHTFTLNDALLALTQYPILVGMNWYNNMFTPDVDGRVRPTGGIAGGHEIVARQIDATRQRVWFDNSWGSSWGVNGRFYLTFTDFGTLLSQQGDVIVLLPKTTPAPTPTSTTTSTTTTTTTSTPSVPTNTPEDIAVAAQMKIWLRAKGLL
jgi:hypothetical protein